MSFQNYYYNLGYELEKQSSLEKTAMSYDSYKANVRAAQDVDHVYRKAISGAAMGVPVGALAGVVAGGNPVGGAGLGASGMAFTEAVIAMNDNKAVDAYRKGAGAPDSLARAQTILKEKGGLKNRDGLSTKAYKKIVEIFFNVGTISDKYFFIVEDILLLSNFFSA